MRPRHEYDTTSDLKVADKLLFFGEVVSIDDPFESRTIKVRIPDFDYGVENNADLPECYPLFPPFFHFLPKVGERVVVLMDRLYYADGQANQEKRYYLGVTISQPQNIENDPYYYTASSNESDGWTDRETPISEIPEARGTYLRKDEVGIAGRKNNDIILKDNEVLIRAGKHRDKEITEFNRSNPAYIQVRYAVENAAKQKKTRTVKKIETIAPTHIINVTSDENNRLLIKVYRNNDNFIEESFSSSYESREKLIQAARQKINEYQTNYPKYQLKNKEPELSDLPKAFKNNQRIVQKQVEIEDQNSFDQFAGSVINMVAEKINVLSHNGAQNYNLTDPNEMIDPETQLEINSNAHPIVYGDILVEFLNLLKQYVATHVHGYHGLPSVKDEIVKKLLNYNLNNLLNENFRTA